VVLHDNTVERTTNGTGSISDMTLEEVQRLNPQKGGQTLSEA
jgi:glycerophosphoryl diester phosphodiesterase